MNQHQSRSTAFALAVGLCLAWAWDARIAVADDWWRGLVLRSQNPDLNGLDEPPEELNPFEEHVETDRDSFTPSTRTVDTGRAVVESSYSFINNRHVAETHSFPELLVRCGVNERIELRFGGNYEVGGEGGDVSGGSGAEGFGEGLLVRESQLLYGLKGRVSDQDGWLPESSVILQGHTPTSGPDPATTFTAAYVIGWEMSEDWKFDAAIRYGADKEKEDHFSAWAPSVVLRKSIAERWNIHAEYFGQFSQSKEHNFVHHFFSPGVHYLITPDLEVGLRVGCGLNDQSAPFFSNVGIGWQF